MVVRTNPQNVRSRRLRANEASHRYHNHDSYPSITHRSPLSQRLPELYCARGDLTRGRAGGVNLRSPPFFYRGAPPLAPVNPTSLAQGQPLGRGGRIRWLLTAAMRTALSRRFSRVVVG